MKRIRIFLACLVCRAARFAARLLGRGGTAMPGKAALKICPELLRELGKDVETVVITGTNGKTTTAGMLRHMLDTAGTLEDKMNTGHVRAYPVGKEEADELRRLIDLHREG